MRAMVLDAPRRALSLTELETPRPARQEVLIKVGACGVCRTDLHLADGDLPFPDRRVVLGHEIVGEIVECGPESDDLLEGTRVGVPWLGWTCGTCAYCATSRENLCPHARFTGYQIDGGYAEYVCADSRYCLLIPPEYQDVDAAPLLCAGLIGYRALRAAGDAARVGLYGFGAAAHIVIQVARYEGREVYAFSRPDDHRTQEFARTLGAAWAGGSDAAPPEPLDAAIIFAPAGELIPTALRALAPGGRVICAGIHMSEIPAFPYEWLWKERSICSIANLTRRDGVAFLELAPAIPIKTTTTTLRLEQANEALGMLRAGRVEGAAVLVP